ncbi:probable serine/threonine-protein kinase PBL7 [Papaver somniferum]|uniref:probable serine/threonine-protein kinase PBL7 n=1 Tax=Papaver somniferum TaxID=3469 RepID=UPI000E6FF9E3|nr:probable serine/threonine-protein kinase PBL7 [Papaver somniferum]
MKPNFTKVLKVDETSRRWMKLIFGWFLMNLLLLMVRRRWRKSISDGFWCRETVDEFVPLLVCEKMKKKDVGGFHLKREGERGFVEETENVQLQKGTEGVEADQAEFQHRVANVRVFKPKELMVVTDAFDPGRDLGQGTFGRVYKGILEEGQEVAVKRYDGQEDLWPEVRMLSCIKHPNLIKMIGYCDKGEEHIIVYEFMSLRSLNLHIHDLKPGKRPLDWKTRMKIAQGVAKALEYLHDQNDPPIIYAGWKNTGVLLDENYNPKLSNFECAKYGPTGDYSTLFSKLRYGYTAGSDICRTGTLTLKSDIYSFGIVLLELISGRKACDITKPHKEHFIHAWARPLLSDSEKFPEIADPLMKGQYPYRELVQALELAKMCVERDPHKRPRIAEAVTVLSSLRRSTH